MSNHAILFLTHILSKRVFFHFKRLQDETKGSLSAFFCSHNSSASLAVRVERAFSGFGIPSPSLEVNVQSAAVLLPERFAQMQRLGRWYNKGFPDLAYLPAMMSEQLRHYDFIWIVEYDVDYAGNWLKFFSDTMDNDADLLTTYAYPRSENAAWYHWSWFEAPPAVLFKHHTSSFNPVARFSRRLLAAYCRAVKSDGWQGHTEALWPTVALHNGMKICDLGGDGPFCPEPWRDKYYYNPVVDGWDNHEPGRGDMPPEARPFWLSASDESSVPLMSGATSAMDKITFIWSPPVQRCFFHENPSRFRQRNVLYHPVKVAPSLLRRHYMNFRSRVGIFS
jgi:hypothetical protein